MRVLLIVAWLFAGLGGLIYHFGPGQERLEGDRINELLKDARSNVRSESFSEAVLLYDKVLADLPSESKAESFAVSLEKAKAQMMAAELPKARQSLEQLLIDVRAEQDVDPELVADVQSTLANSMYYMTWLMRLEGQPEQEWKPEIEAARQHYTQLTKEAEKLGDEAMKKSYLEDLESSIRLARMDLSELQGLPLPSQ